MAIDTENKFVKKIMSYINHYDHDKYWRRRECVVNPNIKVSKLNVCIIYIILKRLILIGIVHLELIICLVVSL